MNRGGISITLIVIARENVLRESRILFVRGWSFLKNAKVVMCVFIFQVQTPLIRSKLFLHIQIFCLSAY